MTRRTERINELLREAISDIVRRDVKDPRVSGLVSITEVNITPDLRKAKVFVSVMGTDEEKSDTFKALRTAAGFVQHALRTKVTLRRVPVITFVLDESMEYGARILTLLNEAREPDDSGQP